MNWMTILKITDEDISGEFPNMPNAAIAEELSDEDIKVEWVERPTGVQRGLHDYFKITMIYRGEEFSSRLVRGHRKIRMMTRIINMYKIFLKIDTHIRETFGENGMNILEQGYSMNNSHPDKPTIFYKLSKPKWAKDIPYTTDERYINIHLEFYDHEEVYGGVEHSQKRVSDNNKINSSSLNIFYKRIKEALHEKFLRKSWKNIIKISETERDIARGSDVWEEEIKYIQKDAEKEWKEKITWDDIYTHAVGYLGNNQVKVLELDKNNLTIEKIFPDISNDMVESIYNRLISHKDYIRIEEHRVYMDLFEDWWSAKSLIDEFDDNPDKLDKLENFLNGLKKSKLDLETFEFRFKPFNHLEQLLRYRIKKQMAEQSSDWKYFSSFKEIEKEAEELFAPDIRAETLVEQVIAGSPNITKVSYEGMQRVLDNIDSLQYRHFILEYLKKGDKNAWVEVVTDMDNIYYVNTKTAAVTGYTCRLMMFNLSTRFCVETTDENLPYGDQVVALLLSLSNESKVREQGQWARFSQEI